MAKYKFDGKKLKDGAKVIANVSGDKLREGSGSKVIANINGEQVRERSGSKVYFNVKGNDLREGTGSKKLATMKDVENAIEGPGKTIKAALWYCFLR